MIIDNYLQLSDIYDANIQQKFHIVSKSQKKSDSIAGSRINCIVYGHSHTNMDTQIGGTKIVCNQLGYVIQQESLDNWLSHVKMINI